MLELYIKTITALGQLEAKGAELRAKSERGDQAISWLWIVGISIGIAVLIGAAAVAWVNANVQSKLNGNG